MEKKILRRGCSVIQSEQTSSLIQEKTKQNQTLTSCLCQKLKYSKAVGLPFSLWRNAEGSFGRQAPGTENKMRLVSRPALPVGVRCPHLSLATSRYRPLDSEYKIPELAEGMGQGLPDACLWTNARSVAGKLAEESLLKIPIP